MRIGTGSTRPYPIMRKHYGNCSSDKQLAMHSRAFLLLRRDLDNLESFPLTGIVAHPQHDNIFTWSAKIEGLLGTLWEGGIFQVSLSFAEDYSSKPPEVHFMTIPFHPNVDPRDGSPALPLENSNGERIVWTISSLLLSLQVLISNPELDEGCIRNSTATKMLKETPITYKQMVLDCITASLRVDAGFAPYESEDESNAPPVEPVSTNTTNTTNIDTTTTTTATTVLDGHTCSNTREGTHHVNFISFDDYHALWRGIATSITGYRISNDSVGLLESDGYLNQAYARGNGMTGLQHKPPIETAPLEQRVNEHIVLKYGKSNKKQYEVKSRKQRIESLKKMYSKGIGGEDITHKKEEEEEEGFVDEVDQLVQWTQNLNEQSLNTTP